jgi:hypothetical protein
MAPYLEAGLVGLGLIRPEEWGMSGTGPLPGVTREMPAICRADLRQKDDSKIEADDVEGFLCLNGDPRKSCDEIHQALILCSERQRVI